ncbi:MAG: heavy metal translocating P-type ATPase [Burkholderiales bacterium]|nr:heavy metal translocating P-type ATPase [Burkholderiales bacterium]
MDCPAEERLIRAALQGQAGVLGLEFDLARRKLTVRHASGSLNEVTTKLNEVGFPPQVESAPAGVAHGMLEHSGQGLIGWRMALAGLAAIAAEALHYGYDERYPALVVVLAVAAVLLGGLETFRKGWAALARGKLNMNSLMSVAVTGAMAIGEWPEAAMVMVLFQLAEIIEARSYERARHAIRGLLELAPETALARAPDGTWRDAPSETIALGALVRVRPGARVPLDGVVEAGRSAVNQAPITGESLPVDKQPGDTVFAGTINQSGELELRVTALADDSTLARIIRVVEQAQAQQGPTQRLVDRFAHVYTPIVFVIAVLVATVPPLFLNAAFMPWLYKALVLLVIACPCALVISTPVTVVSGLAAAARHGILVKGGVFLEQARKLRALAFDKTGTVTAGKPSVTDVRTFGDMREGDALRLAASLAARSDHPISAAVAGHAAARAIVPQEMRAFEAVPGRGVRGRNGDGWFYLGNHHYAEDLGVCGADIEAALDPLEAQGKSAVLLANEKRVLALFAVADSVRETSRAAIAELHAFGIRTAMLTGDNPHTARAIADAVGIDDARGDLLPEDKLAAIEELAATQGVVGMVGDGINDAPALAKASIGIAMGAAGSDIAIETADIALMDDDLRKVPTLIRLSRRTAAVLAQNVALALGIKAVFLVMTVAGLATMWMAVFADMGASLIVVANGLRLLRTNT